MKRTELMGERGGVEEISVSEEHVNTRRLHIANSIYMGKTDDATKKIVVAVVFRNMIWRWSGAIKQVSCESE